MIRNFKGLGLALVAMLAMAAVSASSASAQTQGEFTTVGAGPATVTAVETPGAPATENRLTAFGKFVQCPGSTYTLHKAVTTPHELLPNKSTTATVTPHYKTANHNCSGTLGSSVTVHMNGCDYVLHLGNTTGGVAGTYGATFDVVCPDGKEITVTVWTNTDHHTADVNNVDQFCILHVPSQNGLAGAHITTLAGGKIGLKGTVEGITVKQTRGPHGDFFNQCPNTEEEKAKFDINVEGSGKNALGEAVGISISD